VAAYASREVVWSNIARRTPDVFKVVWPTYTSLQIECHNEGFVARVQQEIEAQVPRDVAQLDVDVHTSEAFDWVDTSCGELTCTSSSL
jgi:hypothetical protein